MGCVSSKLVKGEIRRDIILNSGCGDGGQKYVVNHVVSLTSSTYGLLNLDKEQKPEEENGLQIEQEQKFPVKGVVPETKKKKVKGSPPREKPEVINAWELMEGLEEEVEVPISNHHLKKSPRTRLSLREFAESETRRSPLKFLNQFSSPRKVKKFGGKENQVRVNGPVKSDFSPKFVLKVNSSCKKALNLSTPTRNESLNCDNNGVSPRRRSLSPLFDPELIANYEMELSEGEEQIKRIISPTFSTRNRKASPESLLNRFDKKCPPGGENSVVIYTTTLRGIRKTFEDCNKVRSIIESHQIQTFERDVSMDSGFKEELRRLMETKEVKVPTVFVRGRLIGGVNEVLKLDEEGKLEILLEGIPKAIGGGCEGCAGMRFMMCMQCNGSCKVLDEEMKKMVRCGECNENGLIQCPICC